MKSGKDTKLIFLENFKEIFVTDIMKELEKKLINYQPQDDDDTNKLALEHLLYYVSTPIDEMIKAFISQKKEEEVGEKVEKAKIDFSQLPLEIREILFQIGHLSKNNEIELTMLESFYQNFSEMADLNIISIGCNGRGCENQQIYSWLEEYCQANPIKKVNIYLFDPYFYNEDHSSEKFMEFPPSKKLNPEFIQEKSEEWQSQNNHIFTSSKQNIKVEVFKSFPNWGFEVIGSIFMQKFLEPLINNKIVRDEKVIISQHTGGSEIHPLLTEMYDKLCAETKNLNDNLILFGNNKEIKTLEDNSKQINNYINQYFGYNNYSKSISGEFPYFSVNNKDDMPLSGAEESFA